MAFKLLFLLLLFFHTSSFYSPPDCDGWNLEFVPHTLIVQTVVVINACAIRAGNVTGLPLAESDSLKAAPIITGLSASFCLNHVHAL